MTDAWPVPLRGVTETVVTTLGPNDRYNVAALGIRAGDDGPVTARTWGRTRTRRNFECNGFGYVQFVRDPILFVEAALSITERDRPELDSSDATVEVVVDRRESGTQGGTEWVDWTLEPDEVTVHRECVPTFNRGFGAVVEATVAVSRLSVETYDTETLHERIDYFETVVDRCGGPAEREAFANLRDYIDEEL